MQETGSKSKIRKTVKRALIAATLALAFLSLMTGAFFIALNALLPWDDICESVRTSGDITLTGEPLAASLGEWIESAEAETHPGQPSDEFAEFIQQARNLRALTEESVAAAQIPLENELWLQRCRNIQLDRQG